MLIQQLIKGVILELASLVRQARVRPASCSTTEDVDVDAWTPGRAVNEHARCASTTGPRMRSHTWPTIRAPTTKF